MKFSLVVLSFLLGVCCAQTYYAHCRISGTAFNPGMAGWVLFEQNATSVKMTVNVTGVINAGVPHGIHVHQFGDINFGNASSVGNHYNPLNASHGCPENGTSRHLGDTGNWDVDASGNIMGEKVLDLLTLFGTSSIIGRGLVIHNSTDDCRNVPSSGSRLGYCVIGVANPTYWSATANPAVSGASASEVTSAVCKLEPINNSGITGLVYFEQASASAPTKVSAQIFGLDNLQHGFHVHEYGDLRDNAAGLSVGGHYNPKNGTHSLPGYGNPHVGDMGNIFYYEGNTAYYLFVNENITLNGMYNIIGRTVVVHALLDNCTLPSSGGRRAYCVVGINGGFSTLSLPQSVPAVQANNLCAPAPSTTVGVSTTGTANDASSMGRVSPFLVLALVILQLFI